MGGDLFEFGIRDGPTGKCQGFLRAEFANRTGFQLPGMGTTWRTARDYFPASNPSPRSRGQSLSGDRPASDNGDYVNCATRHTPPLPRVLALTVA